MTIEGNWIAGAHADDYPNLKYKVVRCPPARPGPRARCVHQLLGHRRPTARTSGRRRSLVEYLTSADQQLAFAKAFGVMPSRPVGQGPYLEQFPDFAAVRRRRRLRPGPGAARRRRPTCSTTSTPSSQSLANADPKAILDSVQTQPRPRRSAAESPGHRRIETPPGLGGGAPRRLSHREPAARQRGSSRRQGAIRPAGCSSRPRHAHPAGVLPAAADPACALWVSASPTGPARQPAPRRRELRRHAELRHAAHRATAWPGRTWARSLRNNLYYVLLVVPLQTVLALFAGASLVNQRRLRGQELLPHRVLLPFGDQLGGHHHRLPVPVHRRPARSTRCSPGSASTGRTGSPTPAACSTCCSARSASTTPTTGRAGRPRASSA